MTISAARPSKKLILTRHVESVGKILARLYKNGGRHRISKVKYFVQRKLSSKKQAPKESEVEESENMENERLMGCGDKKSLNGRPIFVSMIDFIFAKVWRI